MHRFLSGSRGVDATMNACANDHYQSAATASTQTISHLVTVCSSRHSAIGLPSNTSPFSVTSQSTEAGRVEAVACPRSNSP